MKPTDLLDRHVSLSLELNWLLMDFATALARVHPDPEGVLREFRALRAEIKPVTDPTPAQQEAADRTEDSQRMLERVLEARVMVR